MLKTTSYRTLVWVIVILVATNLSMGITFRNYNRTAWEITHQLERLRAEMVEEMGKPEADRQRLDEITKEIGELHTRLKNVTIDYYMGMKTASDEEQKEKLNEIFKSMLKQNEDVKLPGGYGRKGRGFRNNN